MKATVLSDYWKSNLSAGDVVTNADYPERILIRAAEGGYLNIEGDSKPTMNNTKKEIEVYLDANDIPYDEYATKPELLKLCGNDGEGEKQAE